MTEKGDFSLESGFPASSALHPNQFQVNEAWIVFQLNEIPIHTEQDGSFNCICLMDAASCFLLCAVLVPSAEKEPSQAQARQMFTSAWAKKGEFPQTLFMPVNRRAIRTSFRRPTLTRVRRLFEGSRVSDFI